MFVLLKIARQFFLPPTLLALGMLTTFFLLKRRVRWARRILLLVFLTYYILSIGPTAYFLARSLEQRLPRETLVGAPEGAVAIVVLAGGAQKQEGAVPFPELGGASWKRLWHGITLYRQWGGKLPVLYSGGSGDPFNSVSHEAALAKEYAIATGIPSDDFLIEDASRNTYESAAAIKKILETTFSDSPSRSIVLVTSARHMPRALFALRTIGVSAIPSPADFSAGALHLNILSFLPSEAYFASSIGSLHEWVGIAGYWLWGRM